MLSTIAHSGSTVATPSAHVTKSKNFARKDGYADTRTAGSIPSLEWQGSAKSQSVSALERAAKQESPFQYVMNYSIDQNMEATEQENKPYDFYDVLDVINPLQHLPVVSTLYRAISGDEIRAPARIIGGAIYGGPVGAAVSVVNAVVEEETGRDLAGNVIGAAFGEDITHQSINIDYSRNVLNHQPGVFRDVPNEGNIESGASKSAHKNFARNVTRAYEARYNS
jgi:hypothetical protein